MTTLNNELLTIPVETIAVY